jgi:sirohydrochlorin ferrochelatase
LSALAVTTAVVLVAHGERGGEGANARAVRLVDEVGRGLGGDTTVTVGFLKARPALEEALEQATAGGIARLIVLPLLMSDGYFAQALVPAVVASAGAHATRITLAPPIGCERAMHKLALDRARTIARRRGWETASVLVVGHGTRASPASRRTTEAAAAVIAGAAEFARCRVAFAFLDDEPPVAEALSRLPRPVVVVPYLWSAGRHALEDLGALAEADVDVDRPLGEDEAVAAIAIASLRRAGAGGRNASSSAPRRTPGSNVHPFG